MVLASVREEDLSFSHPDIPKSLPKISQTIALKSILRVAGKHVISSFLIGFSAGKLFQTSQHMKIILLIFL